MARENSNDDCWFMVTYFVWNYIEYMEKISVKYRKINSGQRMYTEFC